MRERDCLWPELTIMLPAYNEEAAIGLVLNGLPRVCKVVVGNNNSTDRTAEIAEQTGAEVINVPTKGKGAVVREMARRVGTKYVICCDSDYTYPLVENLWAAYDLMANRGYDAVLFYRKHVQDGAMSLSHKIGNFGLSALTSVMTMRPIRDVVSGMWGAKSELLPLAGFRNDGFTPDAEFVVGMARAGVKIAQMPIAYRPRPEGTVSKLKMLDGVHIAREIVARALLRKNRR